MASQKLLMRLFKFDDRDLVANRAGQMTVQQRRKLHWKFIERILASFLNIALGIFVVGAILLSLIARQTDLPDQLGVLAIIALISGFIFLVFRVLQIGAWQAYRHELQSNAVDMVEGKIGLDLFDAPSLIQRNRKTYIIKIARLRFAINSIAYGNLKTGESYRLYYSPHSMTLLSIEPLDIEHAQFV